MTGKWKIKAARSSAAARSQIHIVQGQSSSLVARRVEDASNEMEEHPPRTSVDCLVLLLPLAKVGGETVCVDLEKECMFRPSTPTLTCSCHTYMQNPRQDCIISQNGGPEGEKRQTYLKCLSRGDNGGMHQSHH